MKKKSFLDTIEDIVETAERAVGIQPGGQQVLEAPSAEDTEQWAKKKAREIATMLTTSPGDVESAVFDALQEAFSRGAKSATSIVVMSSKD